MAKTLPPYGDQYLGDNPWAKRIDEVIMYLSGRNTSAVVPFGTDVDSDDIAVTASSAAQTVSLWTLPAGVFVYSLYAITPDSWGSSDDGNITVGDTGSVDTWFTDTLLMPSDSANGPSGIARSNALAPPAGRFYDTGATIAATFPLATTACVTGLTKFILVYSMAR